MSMPDEKSVVRSTYVIDCAQCGKVSRNKFEPRKSLDSAVFGFLRSKKPITCPVCGSDRVLVSVSARGACVDLVFTRYSEPEPAVS